MREDGLRRQLGNIGPDNFFAYGKLIEIDFHIETLMTFAAHGDGGPAAFIRGHPRFFGFFSGGMAIIALDPVLEVGGVVEASLSITIQGRPPCAFEFVEDGSFPHRGAGRHHQEEKQI
jgi:hypothetical protein